MSSRTLALAVGLSLVTTTVARADDPPSTPPAPPTPATDKRPPRHMHRERKHHEEPTGPVATYPGFTMLPDGTSRLFVELTAPVQVATHAAKGQVTYSLPGARIDQSNNRNPLETWFYETPVVRARLKTHHEGKGKDRTDEVELEVELRADVTGTLRTVPMANGGSRIEIDFPAGRYRKDGDEDGPPQRHRDEDAPPKTKEHGKHHGKAPPPDKKGPPAP